MIPTIKIYTKEIPTIIENTGWKVIDLSEQEDVWQYINQDQLMIKRLLRLKNSRKNVHPRITKQSRSNNT